MRRQNMREGIVILDRAGLVGVDGGGSLLALDATHHFVGLLECEGSAEIKNRCAKAATAVGGMTDSELADAFSEWRRQEIEALRRDVK